MTDGDYGFRPFMICEWVVNQYKEEIAKEKRKREHAKNPSHD